MAWKTFPMWEEGSRLPSEHQWRTDTGKAGITRMGGFVDPSRMGIGYDAAVTGKHSKIHSTSVTHGSSGQRICK